jgi:plastocyanin
MRKMPVLPAALAALVLLIALLGCSKDKGTNPSSTAGAVFDIPLPPGRSAVFTFDHAATHPYHCGVHPEMTGTVNINSAATDDSAVVTVSSVAGGFNPDPVTIKVGGHVRWVNTSASIPHSVVND